MMENLKLLSYFMMVLLVFGSFAPFATAVTSSRFGGGDYGSTTNTWQSSRPTFDSFYSGSMDTYWPILTQLEKDQCDSVSSDFVVMIPPFGCEPQVVRSDLLAEQNVPVFCQLSAIRINPLIDVSTIKSISFKGDYPDEVAGISFHPARAAVSSYKTLIGDPIEENIGYVVIVLKRQPDERNLEEYISGMLTATIKYDAQGAFGTGAGEYYLETTSDEEWGSDRVASASSFWGGKGYLRATSVDSDEATIEVLTGKNDVYRTVTLKEGETSSLIYYPGYYCTAALKLKLNKIDNSEDMAKIDIEGDSYWVRKGSKFLDGKCTVRDLNVFPGGSGEVEISCSGSSKFKLMLGDRGVILNNGTTNIPVLIGNSIKGEGGKNYYLGYYGKNDDLKEKEFVVLFDEVVSEDEVSDITRIFETGDFEDEEELEKALKDRKIFRKGGEYRVIPLNDDKWGITFVSMEDGLSDGKYSDDSLIPHYMDESKKVVSQLVDNFVSEKKESEEYWGEDALYKQIGLAGEVEDEKMQIELIDRFLKEYPGSINVEYLRDLKLKLSRYNYQGSSKNVFVNNDNYNIRVDGFVSGGGENDKVEVNVGGVKGTLERGHVYSESLKDITGSDDVKEKVPRLTVLDIDGSSAEFNYVWKDTDKSSSSSKRFSVDVGSYLNVGDEVIRVVETQVREVAYVSLIPEVRNTKTEANFTFNIGIEKRAIELSPEMAQKKVDALNKSIADWENKLEKLGKLIKGLKGACLGISTVLMFKNMFTGFVGGTALARGKVMDYYEKLCRERGASTSAELYECYNDYYEEDIEKAIDEYGAAVIAVNERVKCAKNDTTVSSKWGTSEVIPGPYIEELKKCAWEEDSWSYEIDGKTKTVLKKDLDEAKDIQAVLLSQEACKNPKSDACKMANEELQEIMNRKADSIEKLRFEDESKKAFGVVIPAAEHPNKDATLQQAVSAKGTSIQGVSPDNYLAQVYNPEESNERYIVELNKNAEVVGIYDLDGKNVEDEDNKLKNKIAGQNKFNIPPTEDSSCSNEIKGPYVKYYETANKQGFAAVVPFDLKNGWYAYVKKDGYSDSGVLRSFSICNVGRGGIIDDGPGGGDVCAQFIGSSTTHFTPCLSKDDKAIKVLYSKAEAAIMRANSNGNGLSVDGTFVHKTAPLAPESVGADCTQFMTLDDCGLMFNVCDPVICPTSRCNLGGEVPVSDVIASGIIGSLVLCLPNFGDPSEGKVLIPICLSGVHAGLDAYVSILKSYKSCLERNIETGEYVGICDEITSIYMCEFFWGQLSPILDTLLVRFVEKLHGGFQVRGGAEYLTIQKSFENLDNSINYFASTYTGGALRAFSVSSTEEIGSMVCKGFVGSSMPTSADMIDGFLEPDSPTQFYAHFSEEIFSEATVPSTSHYKVYYHIYAGNDEGAQYRVYLKSPPESSYYASRPTLLVKSGYAEVGVAADEAIDFTAPTGYKELCVSINGQDNCGFGSVTSDFGLNHVSQNYVADQADDRQISKTEDCVTTSTSLWGMASPNLQAGVEKSIGGDDIAATGIIRVCASINPEQGVMGGDDVYCKPSDNESAKGEIKASNPRCGFGYSCKVIGGDIKSDVGICENDNGDKQTSAGRWVDVGYCDTESVRCWLDKDSVEDNLGIYMAMNNITSVDELVRGSKELEELNEEYKTVRAKLAGQREALGKLDLSGMTLDGDKDDAVDEIEEEIREIITALDEVAGLEEKHIGQGSNADKAEALALKASVYMTVVRELLKRNPEERVIGGRETGEGGEVSGECGDKECFSFENGFLCSEEECEEWGVKIGKECIPKSFGLGCEEVKEDVGDEKILSMDREASCESDCRDIAVDKGEEDNFNNWKFDIRDSDECYAMSKDAFKGYIDTSGCCCWEESVGGQDVTNCQIEIGKRILEIAGEINTNNRYDATVEKDTGVESFECLVLQIAMKESSLRHCNDVINDDCFVCNTDESLTNLRNNPNYDKNAYGVMQINTAVHDTDFISIEDVGDFNNSVRYAIEKVLIQWGYNEYKDGKDFRGTIYRGWNAALRSYNGWGSGGNINYVKDVLDLQGDIAGWFPACGGDGEIDVVEDRDEDERCDKFCKTANSLYSGIKEQEGEDCSEENLLLGNYFTDSSCCCYFNEGDGSTIDNTQYDEKCDEFCKQFDFLHFGIKELTAACPEIYKLGSLLFGPVYAESNCCCYQKEIAKTEQNGFSLKWEDKKQIILKDGEILKDEDDNRYYLEQESNGYLIKTEKRLLGIWAITVGEILGERITIKNDFLNNDPIGALNNYKAIRDNVTGKITGFKVKVIPEIIGIKDAGY